MSAAYALAWGELQCRRLLSTIFVLHDDSIAHTADETRQHSDLGCIRYAGGFH